MSKVYIADNFFSAGDLFQKQGFDVTKDIEEASLVVLTGGVDISTGIYNQRKLESTQSPNERRDIEDINVFKAARNLNIPMVGICRGAQLIHCLMGGELWQHVTNHGGGTHPVFDHYDDNWYLTTTCHHQQMRAKPKQSNFKLVASASEATSKTEPGCTYNLNPKSFQHQDWEVVFYPELKALCYQGHPEWNHPMCQAYFLSLCKRYELFEPKFLMADCTIRPPGSNRVVAMGTPPALPKPKEPTVIDNAAELMK